MQEKILRTNYILIDFENVQTRSLEPFTDDHFKVILFVGASQAAVPYEVAESVQRLGPRAEYIRISGHGRDALDFHIAYHIGRLAVEEPSAYFHIISKDKGFDSLIQHLRSNNIPARRVECVDDIPAVKVSKRKTTQERIALIVSRLQQLNSAKPASVKTLSSMIASLFHKHLSEKEVASLVQGLTSRGYVVVTGAKVSYALPSGSNGSTCQTV